MLSAPLEHAFNNGSRGFAVCSRLPGCLSLFWVAYFLARLTSWITVWLCAAKPNSILETLLSAWMVFPSFWLHTGGPHYQASRLIDKDVVTHTIQPALHVQEQVIHRLKKFFLLEHYLLTCMLKSLPLLQNWKPALTRKKISVSYGALFDPKFRTRTKNNLS